MAVDIQPSQEMTRHDKIIAFSLLYGIMSQVSMASDMLTNYDAERSGDDL